MIVGVGSGAMLGVGIGSDFGEGMTVGFISATIFSSTTGFFAGVPAALIGCDEAVSCTTASGMATVSVGSGEDVSWMGVGIGEIIS